MLLKSDLFISFWHLKAIFWIQSSIDIPKKQLTKSLCVEKGGKGANIFSPFLFEFVILPLN